MTKRALILALPLGLFAIGATGCGGQKFDEQTLKYTERDTNDFGFVDAPPKTKMGNQGPEKTSPGDILTFRSDVVDAAKKRVGDLNATCTITKSGGGFDNSQATCLGTVTLPGGNLSLAVGGKVFGGVTRGSVVGGTGKYEGAIGSFSSTNSDNAPSHDTFHIFVPKS
jgi:hypothetical protein